MRKALCSAAFLLVAASAGFGQSYAGGFNYKVAFPLGDTKDYIGKTSWVGFGIEGREFIRPNISLGLSFQWNSFKEEVRDKVFPEAASPYEQNAAVIPHSRDTKAYPLLATAHFYLRRAREILPFAGIGVGILRVHRSAEAPLNTYSLDKWLLGLAPEMGIIALLGEDVGLLARLRYIHGFKSGAMPSQSFFSIEVGFLWIHIE